MKKVTISLFLAALLFTSCEKDCEANHTATLQVTNATAENVYVRIEAKEYGINPNHSSSFEIDLRKPGNDSNTYSEKIYYSREGSKDVIENTTVIYNQCKTTELLIE